MHRFIGMNRANFPSLNRAVTHLMYTVTNCGEVHAENW